MNQCLTFALTRKGKCEEVHLCIATAFPREARHFVAVPEMRLTKNRHQIEMKLTKSEQNKITLMKIMQFMRLSEMNNRYLPGTSRVFSTLWCNYCDLDFIVDSFYVMIIYSRRPMKYCFCRVLTLIFNFNLGLTRKAKYEEIEWTESSIATAFTHNCHPNRASVFYKKTCCPVGIKCEGLAGQVLLRNITKENIEKENYLRKMVIFYKTFNDSLLRFMIILPQNELYSKILRFIIMLCGDIESNPGPESFQIFEISSTNTVFQQRLAQVGLEQLDVGGEGDCFFRAVSHQLYGDPSYHAFIRNRGVQYLVENPERFIEANLRSSWIGYINSMSTSGTWSDALMVQAVADALNITINIVESNEGFAPYTIIEPVNNSCCHDAIYIGHIDEMHYVSTIPLTIELPPLDSYDEKENADFFYNARNKYL